MSLPGYQVNIIQTPPSPSEYIDIGTLFVAGKAANAGFGLVYSIDQFETTFGQRQATSPLYDGLQVFFREGGFRAYISAVAMAGVDADIVTAIDAFTPDLGPGSMAAFGLTTSTVQLALANACQNGGRIALLDAADTPTAATMVTAATAITSQPGDHFSAMFAPWDSAPGLTGGAPSRIVPPSARVAGNLARNDALGYSSGDPAAGVLGIARYVQSLSQSAYSDADRQTLNEAGVNVSRVVLNGVRTYGWRTLANQTTDSDWTFLNGSRVIMAVKSALSVAAENFEFSKLDGLQKVTRKFQGVLSGVLIGFWNSGDLFGDTSKEAFSVDTGPAVNTATTFAQGQLSANVGLRTSGMAEQVIINIAKVPITESLAA